jgi:hypothetical protein
MVDFFDKVYSFQSSNKFLAKIRFFSGLRLITKITANFVVPVYYLIIRDFARILIKDDEKSNKRIIVSLTSFPNRIDRLWIVIESLLRQSYKPDLIILWLSKEQFNAIEELPKKLLNQQKKGLEIKLRDDDLKSHKKYFYAFKEYKDDVIVTFDDDVIYSSKVLETLVRLNERFPLSICCNVGHQIAIGDGEIQPYNKWKQLEAMMGPRYDISFIGVGGVLYPPGSLPKEVFNNDVFKKNCMNADDIWLKAMSLLGKATVVKSDYFSNYLPVIHFNNKTLSSSNISLNKNDEQIKNVRNYYSQNLGIDPFSQIIVQGNFV